MVVRRNTTVVATESFSLNPRLVRITSASPNPFLPWIDDDIKDESTITYQLLADSQPLIVRVYKANASGHCCGAKVREDNENNVMEGTRTWVWDGRGDGGGLQGKGDYFVRITAEDPAHVVKTSKPYKVSIARTYRATDTMQKSATAYHHIGPVTAYLLGELLRQQRPNRSVDHVPPREVHDLLALEPARRRTDRACLMDVRRGLERHLPVHQGPHDERLVDARRTTAGQVRCRVDKAKITYSRPVAS